MKHYLETINYSSANEDGRSEIKALDIHGTDTILCITGSGARPLDLLIMKPSRIISIDFNPCQNYLMELKAAAIKSLDYDELLEFIGINHSIRRNRIYRNLRESLSGEARYFWDRNQRMIERGVVYQGRWERHFRKLAKVVDIICPKQRDALFNCGSVVEQSRIWRDMRKGFLWRTFLLSCTSKWTWRFLLRDPGFYSQVGKGFSVCEYVDERLTSFFDNLVAANSPFATLLFYGKHNPDLCLPLHLKKENYKTLKDRISSVETITQSLQEYLAGITTDAPHKYSLSDIASYTSSSDYETVWRNLVAVAPSGARICERQFLVKREVGGFNSPAIRRNPRLEHELSAADDSIFYTFVVVEVRAERHEQA